MAEEEEAQGPRLVWTFPLVTRIQQGSRFLDVGSNVGSMVGGNGVGSRVRDKVSQDSDSPDAAEDSGGGVLDQVESKIDDVKEGTDDTFSSSYSESAEPSVVEIEIQDGVFVPTRASIDVGDTVRWVNEDDEVHRISSIEDEKFTSDQIEPGQSFEHTFTESGVVVYVDTISGGESMSGAVMVGDVEPPDNLPSESGDDLVLFSEEQDEGGEDSGRDLSTRSMSAAADEKDDMEIGFSD